MNVMAKKELIYTPSFLPIPNQNMKLKEIVKEDIIKIGNNLAKSALRSKKDGFDGIILHRTYFSLVI